MIKVNVLILELDSTVSKALALTLANKASVSVIGMDGWLYASSSHQETFRLSGHAA